MERPSYEELLEKNRKSLEENVKLDKAYGELKENYGKLLAERNRLFHKVADIMETCSD